MHRKSASMASLGLARADYARLARLDSPARIQAFLNAIPANHEPDGETLQSVQAVLRTRRAHCMEGAMLAACALWIGGRPPLLMHLDAAPIDYPHVVALFRVGGLWGALSKTNRVFLRYRDPIYRSLRELAMSYFHEYCDDRGHKTLRAYSRAFDLRRVPSARWVTNEEPCWDTHEALVRSRHYALLPARAAQALLRRDRFERRIYTFEEFPRPSGGGRR